MVCNINKKLTDLFPLQEHPQRRDARVHRAVVVRGRFGRRRGPHRLLPALLGGPVPGGGEDGALQVLGTK